MSILDSLRCVSSCLFAFAIAAQAPAPSAPAAPSTAPSTAALAGGIAVVGASASHGFELHKFLGSGDASRQRISKSLGRQPDDAEFALRTHSIGLASLLRELRPATAAPIADFADEWLFMGPERGVQAQLQQAAAGSPELVVALDLLFWFGYGKLANGTAESARVERLRAGLARCSEWLVKMPRCAVVIGDFPDCRDAAKEMIRDDMRPDAATLAQLNEALREWAKGHDNVRIFPLGQLLETMRQGKVKDGADRQVEEAAALQFDRLHPTRTGMTLLVRELSIFVGREFPKLPPLLDAEALAKQLTAGS